MLTGLLLVVFFLIRRQRAEVQELLKRLEADRVRAWPAIQILAELMADVANAAAHSGDSAHLLAKRLDRIFSFDSGEARSFKDAFFVIADLSNAGLLTALADRFPNLTHTELALCGMIRLGLDPACISKVLGYDHEQTFYNRRTDIRKKMGLDRTVSLEGYLDEESRKLQLFHESYLERLRERYR